MKTITDRLNKITQSLPKNIKLIAVSKKQPLEFINEAYKQGQKDFGENRALELKEKASQLPKDIKWHMIGHLQTKKVKQIIPYVSLIHSVDSLKLLNEINKRSEQVNKVTNCLLQVYIAEEKTKFGFNINEIDEIIEYSLDLDNIKIIGLMGMATFTNNKEKIEKEFSIINKKFNKIKNNNINTLSIGMSNDYEIAINNGSTIVRIGSAIFGKIKNEKSN